MPKFENLTGAKFGFLTVIKQAEHSVCGRTRWQCKCNYNECANICIVQSAHLKSGHTLTCGCLHREKVSQLFSKHKRTKTKEYRTWMNIKQRCYNLNCKFYYCYGARGITMCERWKTSFENFFEDIGLAPGLNFSIERIDNNKNYEPDNCKWALEIEQARNHNVNKNSPFGIRGVSKKTKNCYQVTIGVDNESIYLGCVSTLEEAKKIRMQGEIKHWQKQITK